MEDRQMSSQIVKQLQLASPNEVEKFTGIQNWESKSRSYTKILYNNALLPYDNHAIYCMDKLHLTYKSHNDKSGQDYSTLFRSKKQFDLSEWLTIIPDNRSASYYYYSFGVVVEDVHFGKINLFNTRNHRNCLLEIDNEVLYCQPASWIIAGIFEVAKAFDLHFNNISVVEIARDSNENVYQRLTDVYYQSVYCSETVHRLGGDKKFYKAVTKCKYGDSPDEDDTTKGTFRIGKSTSNVSFKAYDKSKEIADRGLKKHYIQHQHNCILDPNKDVCRVEMTAKSGAFKAGGVFGKSDVDLLYLLDKNNLPVLFFSLLGDRLVFKDLRTKRWVNGNDQYDTISIIPLPSYIRTKEIPSKPVVRKYTHDRNINKTKQMINQFLDRKIGFSSLVDYTIRGVRENTDFALEFRSAYNMVQENHRNKIHKRDQRRLEKLYSALRKSMKKRKVIGLRVNLALLL